MSDRSDGDTRERVLTGACAVFAEKGFRDTTVADICDRAGANIAAVNYYFGGKENLYETVWEMAYARAAAEHGFGAEGTQYGAGWIEQHIRSRIEAIFDPGPGGWFPKLLRREFADPTPLWPKLHDRYLIPMRDAMSACLRTLLGEHATAQQVRCAAMSVISQYMALNLGQELHRRGACGEAPPLEAVVRQLQTFCIGGLREVAARIEAEHE